MYHKYLTAKAVNGHRRTVQQQLALTTTKKIAKEQSLAKFDRNLSKTEQAF